MIGKYVLFLVSFALLQVVGTTAYSYESELKGICKQANTSAKCTFTNALSTNVSQISWLLEGSNVDYGDDVQVNLRPGESITLSNARGRDNCLFTASTNITVYLENGDAKNYIQQLKFDAKDACSLVIQ